MSDYYSPKSDNDNPKLLDPAQTNWSAILFFIFLLILLCVAVICATGGNNIINNISASISSIQKHESIIQTDKTFSDNIGNSFINISEGGFMVFVDDYVYYTNPIDEYKIYRMACDFSSSEKICDIGAFYLNYYKGWLYFAEAKGERCLYRMKPNGTSIEKLNNQPTYEPKVVDDFIFYDDFDDNYSLYYCKLDGTDVLSPYPKGVVFYSCITDKNIYFLDTSDRYKCYSMRKFGTSKTLVTDKKCRELCFENNQLFYSLDGGGIIVHELSSKSKKKISEMNVRSMNVSDSWIYFANIDDKNRLYKMKTDGTDVVKICDDSVAFINVCGNLISYLNTDEKQFYWCLTDGSNNMPVQ